MKTYKDNGHLYFYDQNIKLWTIYPVDDQGNQLSRSADHYNDKEQLVHNHPFVKFTPYIEQSLPPAPLPTGPSGDRPAAGKVKKERKPNELAQSGFVMDMEVLLNSDAPVLVAFSGGKDSVAMVLYLLESGVPKDRIHLHHHDVDGGANNRLFDWACTETYCEAFARHFGLKLFFSYRVGGIRREAFRSSEAKQDVHFQKDAGGEYCVAPSDKTAINTRMKYPAQGSDLNTRWCSAAVKIEVLRTAIAHNPAYGEKIFILTGERREESSNRAKYEEFEFHATNGKKRMAISWRPIIDWTERMVWEIIEYWRVQAHPAYMIGWSRCSCQLCIFSDSNVWATIAKISPEKVEQIKKDEEAMEFSLYPKEFIREKVAKGVAFDMDAYWVEQAIGKFTAPVVVPESLPWMLPCGAYKKMEAGAA